MQEGIETLNSLATGSDLPLHNLSLDVEQLMVSEVFNVMCGTDMFGQRPGYLGHGKLGSN